MINYSKNHFGIKIPEDISYMGVFDSKSLKGFQVVKHYKDCETYYGGASPQRDFILYSAKNKFGEITVAIQGDVKEKEDIFGKMVKDFNPLFQKLNKEILKARKKLETTGKKSLISLLPKENLTLDD